MTAWFVNVSIILPDLIVENVFRSTMTNRGTVLQQLMPMSVNRVTAMVYLSGVILMRTCIVRRVMEDTVLIVRTTRSDLTVKGVAIIISVVLTLIAVSRATVILLDQPTPNVTTVVCVSANLECQEINVIGAS